MSVRAQLCLDLVDVMLDFGIGRKIHATVASYNCRHDILVPVLHSWIASLSHWPGYDALLSAPV